MSYVDENDLLLGELTNSLPSTISVSQYLDMTQEEIDSKLGVIYAVPIAVDDLPNSQGSLIKSIHRKLCSGRVILAATIGHDVTTIHAYGMQLVKEGLMELMAIANNDVVLIGAERVDGDGNPLGDIIDAAVADPLARVPSGSNRDDVSGVEMFEMNFMMPGYKDFPVETWHPGAW
jgi:hypothetical protein